MRSAWQSSDNMRMRRIVPGLPRSFASHPAARAAVAEFDIRIGGRGAMAAKVLVFKDSSALTRFWWKAMGHKMSPGALGAVNALAREASQNGVPKWIEVDPHYFCVIGLTASSLCMEVITHESIHAGFAYAKRHARNYWVEQGDDYSEEDVAYPAGRIAKAINAYLHDKGLYQ